MSSHFRAIVLTGPRGGSRDLSDGLRGELERAPRGKVVSWGIPFVVRPRIVQRKPVCFGLAGAKGRWIVLMHTADLEPLILRPMRGEGRLGEPVADYVLVYDDGTEVRHTIRRRFEIGAYRKRWGELCFEAVSYVEPAPRPGRRDPGWGDASGSYQEVVTGDWMSFLYWLWAWENPKPSRALDAIRIEPRGGAVVLAAASAGDVTSHPLRWGPREKALLRVRAGTDLADAVNVDLGKIISVKRRPIYPNRTWSKTPAATVPSLSEREVIVEYTAHPEARIRPRVSAVSPANVHVRLRVVDASTGTPLPVRLHVHGEAGEYLAPRDRVRTTNTSLFEDRLPEFSHQGVHPATYIDGQCEIELPIGKVYLEISKGFEIEPIRTVRQVTPRTRTIELRARKVLDWRRSGWVTADTHVHFLPPTTALLEGAGEGVNIVNVLATQWGEAMMNVGDFDGRTMRRDGEWFVRVGTENRQHLLGHISLIGYRSPIILPLTTGGPDESALGDPVDALLMDWARACRKQGGLVVLPHFPDPRAEGAAAIVEHLVDGIEMTSWGRLYDGIDPYSLADWYRYLNCGYFVPAVGGTDKMDARTPVGAIRTYAKLPKDEPLTYAAWLAAVRAGRTFVSYGPLVELEVDGHPPMETIRLGARGGTVDVTWRAASLLAPMSRVDLVVNGTVRESVRVRPRADQGSFRLRLDKSSWIALLVRGAYRGKREVIQAHTSPVIAEVNGSPFFDAVDASTILEQIEGAVAWVSTLATRPEARAYRRMRLALVAAHRRLHNRMHEKGVYHPH